MIYPLCILLIALLNLLLGIFVLSRGVNKKPNRYFCLWVISAGIWQIMDFGLCLSPNPEFALKWVKIMIIGVMFIPSTFFAFIVNMLKETDYIRVKLIPIGYLLSITFYIFSLTGLFISDVYTIPGRGYFPTFNPTTPFPPLFLIFFYGFTLVGVFLLFRRLKRASSALEKNQIKYLLWGLNIAILGGISNFVLAFEGNQIFPIGNLSEAIFVWMTAIAIVRYRLMDIDIIIRPGITYAILTSIVTVIWLGSIFFFENIVHFTSLPSRILGIFIAIFIFNILKDKVQSIVDRLFYKERQELASVSEKAIKEITSTIDPEIITTSCLNVLSEHLHPQFISLFLPSENKKSYEVQYIVGEGEKPILLSADEPLIKWLKEKKRALFKERLLYRRVEEEIEEGIRKTKAALILPLIIGDNLIGVLTVGEKKGATYYSYGEINLFNTITKELALALENTRLYGELKEKTVALEAANQIKSNFLNTISHELNTPLTVIIGELYLLERALKTVGNKTTSTAMEKIKKKLDQLSFLIEEILDVAYLEKGGKYVSKREHVNIKGVITNMVDYFKILYEQKGIQLKIDFEEEISLISDSKMIENILFRLINNAIKFTSSGGWITVGAKKGEKDEVLFFVQDTGVGIKKDDQQKIFDRFVQVDGSTIRRYDGVGLGLSIVKEMVETLSGRIWVESELNKGSKFIFMVKNLS